MIKSNKRISKWEELILPQQKNCSTQRIKLYFFLLMVTLLAFLVRYWGRDYVSTDMERALLPWFQEMQTNGGLAALSKQVGDYCLLYQTIIAVFTYVDMKAIYLYKLFSSIFDFLLSASIVYFTVNGGNCTIFKKNTVVLCYMFVILLPTVVMNSAFWGQCDSVYTFFLLWSIWFLYKEKYRKSFILLGCAFAFKLQSILLVPLFFYIWVCRKNSFSLLNFELTIMVFWLSGIVTYFYKRGLIDGFIIYILQVGEYKKMWMNVPSFWMLTGGDYASLHMVAIFLTILILGIVFFLSVAGKISVVSFEKFISLAAFVEWTCILFLPAMHERYTYVMDLLLLMLSFMNTKYIKYAAFAISLSCLTYVRFLVKYPGDVVHPFLVIIYLGAWLHFSYALLPKQDPNATS